MTAILERLAAGGLPKDGSSPPHVVSTEAESVKMIHTALYSDAQEAKADVDMNIENEHKMEVDASGVTFAHCVGVCGACVAVWRGAVQRGAAQCSKVRCNAVWRGAVRCGAMHCVAVWCDAMQRGVMRCSCHCV